MIARLLMLIAVMLVGLGCAANAAECAKSKAVPGTLAASATAPCAKSAGKPAVKELAKPKDPSGAFRSGTTTVRVRGAVVSDTVIGGR